MAIALLVLAAACVAALFLLPGSTPRISRRLHPNGLAVLEQVPVNGVPLWVLIRSEDIANPVALFVHGGPGTSQLTLLRRSARPLEKHFTVVDWDQRGAGKSFAAANDGRRMTIDDYVDDVLDLASYLSRRFRQEKILLVGHSWGSLIGLLAAARTPELFSAYVGIGQMSNAAESERLSWEWTLAQARAANDAGAVATLERIGAPPYAGDDWQSRFMTERRLLGKFGGEYRGSRTGAFRVVLKNLVLSREYTLRDRVNFLRGIFRSVAALMPELFRTDLFVRVPEVEVPVWFCLGRHDYEVPAPLAARYFEQLRAPRKALVWFENSAHMANTEESGKFNAFMVDMVLPTLKAQATTGV